MTKLRHSSLIVRSNVKNHYHLGIRRGGNPMDRLWQRRIIWETAVRVIADALMSNVALLSALAARYLWQVGIEDGAAQQITLREYIQDYGSNIWLLTLVSLTVFYLSGFYSHGR